MIRNALICALSATLVLTAAGAASASGDSTYGWSFTSTGGTVLADGTLQADSTGDVQSFAGTVVGFGPISSFTSGGGDDGVFEWDNVIVPTSTPHVDYYGIVFQADALEWNIYNGIAGSTTNYDPNGDTLANSSNNYGGTVGTFNLTAVPEPSTWAMMLAGFVAIGFAGYRGSRKGVALAA